MSHCPRVPQAFFIVLLLLYGPYNLMNTEEKSLVVLEQAGVIRMTSYRGKEQL